jgi:hypothetical protein
MATDYQPQIMKPVKAFPQSHLQDPLALCSLAAAAQNVAMVIGRKACDIQLTEGCTRTSIRIPMDEATRKQCNLPETIVVHLTPGDGEDIEFQPFSS